MKMRASRCSVVFSDWISAVAAQHPDDGSRRLQRASKPSTTVKCALSFETKPHLASAALQESTKAHVGTMNLLIRLALEMNAYFSCLHFWDSQFDKVFNFYFL